MIGSVNFVIVFVPTSLSEKTRSPSQRTDIHVECPAEDRHSCWTISKHRHTKIIPLGRQFDFDRVQLVLRNYYIS